MRRVENSAGRHGVGRRAKVERGHHADGGRMDGRRQGHMNVAAVVVVMAERGFAAFIGDIHRLSVSRAIVVRRRVMAVTVVMVVSQIGRVFIGNARELKAVFDPVLIILHAMHLHRDHDGHAQADAKETEQAWQIEIPRSNFVTGKPSTMQLREGRSSLALLAFIIAPSLQWLLVRKA